MDRQTGRERNRQTERETRREEDRERRDKLFITILCKALISTTLHSISICGSYNLSQYSKVKLYWPEMTNTRIALNNTHTYHN